jgi:5'-3' exonuclease
MKCDVLIMDGRHLLWRTSDAFKELEAEVEGKRTGTGGIYGFLACAIRVHGRYGGRMIVAWEGQGNFRMDLFPTYKGKDVPPDRDRAAEISEMSLQERELRRILKLLGVDQYEGRGCEADDVIARLARRAEGNVIIYSGDSDLRQLVNENITCVSPGFKGGADSVYGEEAVLKRHGVPPKLLAQLKAIAGDTSDKIPGAAGIGAVTAAKLLNHYGSLKAVLKAACSDVEGWPETPRRRLLIREAAPKIRLYYKLTKIRDDLPWGFRRGEKSQKAVLERFKRLKFVSLSMPNELSALLKLGGAIRTQ